VAYCTRADVEALVAELDLINLTNDTPGAESVDEDVLDAAIADADALIDGFVGSRYSLPLSTTPVLLTKLSARLARFNLYNRRPGPLEEWLEKDYDRAEALLKQISAGKVSLGLDSGGSSAEPAQDSRRAVRASSRARVFGRGALDGY